MRRRDHRYSGLTILRRLSGDVIPLMTPQQLLTHYLAASYGYYILNESVFMDTDFDEVCRRLLAVFDTFEHRHKHLTSRERLEEGTGYHIREEDYPPQIRFGFPNYVRNLNNGQFEYDIVRIHRIGKDAWIKEYQARLNQ